MIKLIAITGMICLLCVAVVYGDETPPADSLVTVSLNPSEIEVGMFFDGAEVKVSSEIPACDGVVLVLKAGHDEVKLNRKGRVAGIWLNVAQVTVKNVPSVYILGASDKLENLCASDVQQRLGLGQDYLRDEIQFICEKPLTGTEFDEFLRLKTHTGAYAMDIALDLQPAGAGMMGLSGTLPIAATIPPGTYHIMLYGFKDGTMIFRGDARLTIERVGLARTLVNLAHEHGAAYGVLAIAVAMAVGIIMGVIFESLPGSGH